MGIIGIKEVDLQIGHTCTYEIALTGPVFAYSGQDGVVAGIVLTYSGDGNAFCIAGSCGAAQYLYVPSNTGPISAFKFLVSVTNNAEVAIPSGTNQPTVPYRHDRCM